MLLLGCRRGFSAIWAQNRNHATLTVIMTKERERTSIYKALEGEFFFVLLLWKISANKVGNSNLY